MRLSVLIIPVTCPLLFLSISLYNVEGYTSGEAPVVCQPIIIPATPYNTQVCLVGKSNSSTPLWLDINSVAEGCDKIRQCKIGQLIPAMATVQIEIFREGRESWIDMRTHLASTLCPWPGDGSISVWGSYSSCMEGAVYKPTAGYFKSALSVL